MCPLATSIKFAARRSTSSDVLSEIETPLEPFGFMHAQLTASNKVLVFGRARLFPHHSGVLRCVERPELRPRARYPAVTAPVDPGQKLTALRHRHFAAVCGGGKPSLRKRMSAASSSARKRGQATRRSPIRVRISGA